MCGSGVRDSVKSTQSGIEDYKKEVLHRKSSGSSQDEADKCCHDMLHSSKSNFLLNVIYN